MRLYRQSVLTQKRTDTTTIIIDHSQEAGGGEYIYVNIVTRINTDKNRNYSL